MATTTRYALAYRRQREGKTNYKKRLALLKSKKPRLVIRRTNKHFIMQVFEYSPDGDKVSVGAHSQELKKYGWQAATGNMPSAYLTGLLVGKKIMAAKIPEVIADFGLQKVTHKGNLYAALKGVMDAGVTIPLREEFFPDMKRIEGAHIQEYAAKAGAKSHHFAKTKSAAASMPAEFAKTKQKIGSI
jgi:large subunit ribosomal protein L18